ncbi:MAG TPA: prepilin-type N-terminal cleavage/methylation domain-containing protein [Longimicrobium sp.]
MHADPAPRAPRGNEGFTLIEVMIAMVILAVGLLSLEALGIGAARVVTLSEKQGRYATLAASSMESLRHEIRNAPAALPINQTTEVLLVGGDTALVKREATRQAVKQARLTVTVSPKATGSRLVRAAPVVLNSYLFDPQIP